jgi:hypothetical protein
MMDAEEVVKLCARTTIDVTALGVGIVALPISIPLVAAARALRASGRAVAVNLLDGTVPVVGPPIARTLEGLRYEAA